MIGAFRQKIDLLAPAPVADAGGGRDVSFAVVRSPWAMVERLPTISRVKGERVLRVARVKALVRNHADLAVGRRVRIDGAEFDVVSIESDDAAGRRVFLQCEAAL